MSRVTTQTQDHVAVVEFANPPVNYFDGALLGEIADAMDAAANAGARALVLQSAGKHFCAGADFSAIADSAEARNVAAGSFYAAGARLFNQQLPIVAAVQGAAVGGGLGLACASDFRIVAPETRLDANFARLGVHPGFALSVTVPALVGQQRALRMFLTAQPVRGVEAVEIGLADHVVEIHQLRERAVELATEIAAMAPLAVQAIKATQRAALRDALPDVLRHELAEQTRLWATEDSEIGIQSVQSRSKPDFRGR